MPTTTTTLANGRTVLLNPNTGSAWMGTNHAMAEKKALSVGGTVYHPMGRVWYVAMVTL